MSSNIKNHLGFKLFISVITILYFAFFIYNFISVEYNVKNTFDLVKIILLIAAILLFSLTILFNKPTFFFGSLNVLAIISSLILIFTNNLEILNTKKEEIECNKDNINVTIIRKGNNINYLSYSYVYSLDDIEGAQNFVNKFDKQYASIDNVYSEINISDIVTINLIYKMDKIDINKLYKIENKHIEKYDILEKELQDYTCKKKD